MRVIFVIDANLPEFELNLPDVMHKLDASDRNLRVLEHLVLMRPGPRHADIDNGRDW